MPLTIGLLEDDPAQAELVMHWLEGAGHRCGHYARGQDLLEALGSSTFDVLIIDWELPDISGIEVLSRLRVMLDRRIPVLFVTQRDAESDIVTALDRGADDYMVKQISQREFLARVTALSRRFTQTDRIVEVGPFRFDLTTRTAARDGEPVKLTNKDFDLACYMFSNVGRLLSREELLRDVWNLNPAVNTRTVDMHVSHVRKRLRITPEAGYRIRTIYQHGYRLEPVESAPQVGGACN